MEPCFLEDVTCTLNSAFKWQKDQRGWVLTQSRSTPVVTEAGLVEPQELPVASALDHRQNTPGDGAPCLAQDLLLFINGSPGGECIVILLSVSLQLFSPRQEERLLIKQDPGEPRT